MNDFKKAKFIDRSLQILIILFLAIPIAINLIVLLNHFLRS